MPNNPLSFDADSDFVFVESKVELAEEATEFTKMTVGLAQAKDSSRFHLNPTQLNNLNLSYIETYVNEKNKNNRPDFVGCELKDGSVETGEKYICSTAYKKMNRQDGSPVVVFQVTRDSKSDKDKNLAFINDVIIAFLNKTPDKNIKLLMPLSLSRFHGVKYKEHFVLAEVKINGVKKEIMIHNSQSKWSIIGYLNCLKNLPGFKFKEYNNYYKQEDNFSCGFFVYQYVQSILENNNSNQLKNIHVTLNALVSNPTLLEDTLNKNFVKKYPDARKITASGEPLSWEKAALEKELDEAEYQKVKAKDIEFPENVDLEDSAEERIDQKMPCSP